MAYVKQIWANGPSGSTPLNADRMNYIENGLITIESEISQIPLNRQAAAVTAYTLVLSDAGKSVYMQAATAQTLTVPANATVPYPIGTWMEIVQNGAGQLTLAGATGVSVVSTTGLTLAQSSDRVRIQKTQTDTWSVTRINGMPIGQLISITQIPVYVSALYTFTSIDTGTGGSPTSLSIPGTFPIGNYLLESTIFTTSTSAMYVGISYNGGGTRSLNYSWTGGSVGGSNGGMVTATNGSVISISGFLSINSLNGALTVLLSSGATAYSMQAGSYVKLTKIP